MSAAQRRNRRNIRYTYYIVVCVGAKRGHRLFRRQGPEHLDWKGGGVHPHKIVFFKLNETIIKRLCQKANTHYTIIILYLRFEWVFFFYDDHYSPLTRVSQ